MVAVTEKKTSYQKVLLIASGPAMLEKMVRPLKDAGLGVNACENFIDAKGLFSHQALIVLPIKEGEQDEAKGFVEWLRRQGKNAPYILGVGRCENNQRKSLVAKMGLNDLITLPFDETVVQERLESFRRWCTLLKEKELADDGPPTSLTEAAAELTEAVPAPKPAPVDLLQTTRVSLFSDSTPDAEEESPETIYCRETPVGVAMFDQNLCYVLANPRWIQQFRLQEKDVIGRSQFDIFPNLHPNWRKIYQRCLNGETRRGRETVDAGHGPLEMRWEVRPWRYLAGQIGGVTIAFEEVWKPAAPETRPGQETSAGPIKRLSADDTVSATALEAPAVLFDLEGQILEVSPSAKALGISQPETSFLEALKRNVEELPLTELAYHEEATAKVPGRLAWSNTILRHADGKPFRVLRVGVFLPESLLPVTAPQPLEPPASTKAPASPAASALALLQQVEEAGPPEVESFDDETLDDLPELIWKANPRGEITFFNKAWLTYRDRPLSRELNGGWLDGLHLSDARATKAVVAEAIREQSSLEHRFRLKSGKSQFLEVDMWVRPFHEEDGNLLGFYGACRPAREESLTEAEPLLGQEEKSTGWPSPSRDLESERKADDLKQKLARAERELQRLKETQAKPPSAPQPGALDKVFAHAPVMLWTCDAQGQLTTVNHQWERFRDRTSSEEIGGDAWLDGIPSTTERHAIREQLRTAARHGSHVTCRFHWEAGDASARLVEMHGAPLIGADGRCEGLSGSLRDIGEEHQTLTAVRNLVAPESAPDETTQLSELYRQITDKLPAWRDRQATPDSDMSAFEDIFDHVATGIVLLDSDCKPVMANQRHRELLGFGIDDAGDMESWLRRACDDEDHAQAVLKIWQEDIWRRQLTKVVALKSRKGSLRELQIEPQHLLSDNRLLLTINDVTESKRSEEAMRDSEIRFRALFRESSMGIALIDAEEKIYDINPSLERVLGIPRRQLLCRHFDECVHADDLPRKRTLVQDLLHSPKRSAHIELRLAGLRAANDDGIGETWVRLHISLVRDVDQRVLFTAYFVQDITEQKQVEAELLVSQEQNRALLEVIPDLILLVERDGQVIDFMPGEAVPINLPENQSIGGRIGHIVPAFEGEFDRLIDEAYRVDDVVTFPFKNANGQSFEARIVACKPDNAVITVHHQPPTPAAAGATSDTTPPSASSPEPSNLQALTFHSAPDAVILTNYSGAILDWNPAAESLFGYTKEEATGQPMPALFGVDSVDALTRHLQQANGNRWAGDLPYQRKDRTEGTAKVMFVPLQSAGGEHAGQVAFIREAGVETAAPPSESLRAQLLAEQLPQLHLRLRNNLQIISTLLNLQYKSQSNADIRQALLTSRTRTHALLLLHEQIRVVEGQEVVDFGPFARALADHLVTSLGAKERIGLHLQANDVLDLQIASPLALILNELLGNAIHHGFPAPSNGLIHIGTKIENAQGQLTVSNDGLPLDKTATISSGMGLQIVKTLASQIGGTLEKIDSTETEFRVYFKTSLSQ